MVDSTTHKLLYSLENELNVIISYMFSKSIELRKSGNIRKEKRVAGIAFGLVDAFRDFRDAIDGTSPDLDPLIGFGVLYHLLLTAQNLAPELASPEIQDLSDRALDKLLEIMRSRCR